MTCIFCGIVEKNDSATVKHSDKQFVAFNDHSPAATVHLLLIPKKHILNIKELKNSDVEMLKNMKQVAIELLTQNNIKPEDQLIGFHAPPFVFVPHLHLHVIGKPFTSTIKSGLFQNWYLINPWVDIDSAIESLLKNE
ncbi:hypothetical protein HDV01_005261 [Terramyces sp. JEL0728]|nr:hypothetical protein HDV01_005261 [Terramyces sp. JEL0728]